jgi:hypothetical protein
MSFLFLLAHSLWVASALAQGTLLAVMLQRRFYRYFPTFVFCLAWMALKTVALLGMNYAPFVTGDEYYYAFTVGKVGVTVLSFGVLYEVFTVVLRRYPTLRNLGTLLFRWSTVMLVLVAISLAWFAPGTGAGHRMSVLYLLERTVSALQIGLLIFLFIFSRYLGLSWRNHAFGIALGFGILASVSLATSAIRAQIEPIVRNLNSDALDVINEATLVCCVLLWMAYLLAPEARPPASIRTLPEHDLETWNQELQRLLHQ